MYKYFFYLIVLVLHTCVSADVVICVHGFLRTSRSFSRMQKELTKSGHTVYLFDYSSRSKTIEEHGKTLAAYVENTSQRHQEEPLHFVTHSMGALVLRAAMDTQPFQGRGFSGTSTLIAPPNRGSAFARKLRSFPPSRFILGTKSGKQLQCLSESHLVQLGHYPEGYPVLVIAGSKGWNPFLKGPHDGKVLVEETKLNTPHTHEVVRARHPFIAGHSLVIEKTKAFIQSIRSIMSYKTTFLKDYRKPDFTVTDVHLTFDLDEKNTKVTNTMQLVNQLSGATSLVLHGEDIELHSVTINGEKASYEVNEKELTIHNLPPECSLEIVNTLNPSANSRLEGLYMSSGMFCTQNEPEGFRRITYYLDRPDVMAKFTTKIIGDKSLYPVLLSNGNCIDSGDASDGKHYAVWEDPFPKPAYLFALVGGNLEYIEDTFTTSSGRVIPLRIYSENKYLPRLSYAMESLKKSMKWDEDVFGLEYDLDVFMIVAVDSFNAGAMENKGLNIFNTSCVLADPQTETDANFLRVEGVVAHEYFHNWTGDRITCRDWFQLTLKEGLTVFRDQEFSSDMNSRGVKRIEDVLDLRNRQFPEDAGPTSHPIKPDSYIEINNFYTATVYDKGAEVIRMIHTLLGKEGFRKGMDTYFSLYDGQAVTTEDFIHAMEVASGRDLGQFRRWYHQKGTPLLEVKTQYDEPTGTAYLIVRQQKLNEREQEPFHMPFSMALIGPKGEILREEVLELTDQEHTFSFENIIEPPVFSLNRNFSAPVIMHDDLQESDLAHIMAHEVDSYAKWEAGQKLAMRRMREAINTNQREGREIAGEAFTRAFGALLEDERHDNAYKAFALSLPSETEIALEFETVDFDAIHEVREALLHYIATTYQDTIRSLYTSIQIDAPYEPNLEQVGKRKLKLYLLSLIRRLGDIKTVSAHYNSAQNMTDRYGALMQITHMEGDEKDEVFSDFYSFAKDDLLTFNKYLIAVAASSLSSTLDTVKAVVEDPHFDMTIPNMNRSLLGMFSQNYPHFHKEDGSGYEFMADMLLKLDTINPAAAARVAGGFKMYGKLDAGRKKQMEIHLRRMLDTKGLSENLYEVLSKSYEQ